VVATLLWVTAAALTVAAWAGSGVARGANRVAWVAWWAGVMTMAAVWHWWAYR
jgi:hypothetical protein